MIFFFVLIFFVDWYEGEAFIETREKYFKLRETHEDIYGLCAKKMEYVYSTWGHFPGEGGLEEDGLLRYIMEEMDFTY